MVRFMPSRGERELRAQMAAFEVEQKLGFPISVYESKDTFGITHFRAQVEKTTTYVSSDQKWEAQKIVNKWCGVQSLWPVSPR